jgi:hypothetical protein
MASSSAVGKVSREEFRRQKDLDAARKAGTAPAALDEEGKPINPHIPRTFPTPDSNFRNMYLTFLFLQSISPKYHGTSILPHLHLNISAYPKVQTRKTPLTNGTTVVPRLDLQQKSTAKALAKTVVP